MDYVLFAQLSVLSLMIVLVPYVMNFLNRNVFKTKSEAYRKTLKFFRSLHKPMGLIFLIVAFIHGYLVMGTLFTLHTGTLLYASIFATVVLGGAFYRKKKRPIFRLHKIAAFLSVVLFLLHMIRPWAI